MAVVALCLYDQAGQLASSSASSCGLDQDTAVWPGHF